MMGLVDYGSGSESESENDTPTKKTVKKENKKSSVKSAIPENFFDDETSFNEETKSVLNLPSFANEQTKRREIIEENELEGEVKPRDWEQKLAEKARRKLEKKALKKAKKEKDRHKKKENGEEKSKKEKKPALKAKISAFGALACLADESESEEDETPKPALSRPSTSSQSKNALLAMLPAPKTKTKVDTKFGQSASGSSLLLPSTLRKSGPSVTPKAQATPREIAPVLKRKAESDDSDGDDVTDFFGLTSAPEPKQLRIENESEIPLMAAGTGFESFGPSKPNFEEEMHPSQMYNYADVDMSNLPQNRAGYITDEQAYNMLSRDETVQITDRRSLNEITAGIVDVSVDQALGHNVQSSLLKNITKASYIRDVNALPTKSGSIEKVARQKHQITYLAKLAVAREAALEDQWAASKSQKRMGRQKYGF